MESVISPRSPGFFSREWYLEVKICVLGVLIAAGVSLLPGPLTGQIGKTCIYKLACICVYTCTFVSFYLYTYLKPWVHTDIRNFSLTAQGLFNNFFSILVIPFSDSNLTLVYPQHVFLINPPVCDQYLFLLFLTLTMWIPASLYSGFKTHVRLLPLLCLNTLLTSGFDRLH